MGRPKNVQPSYLLHQASGQARVRIDGEEIFLGKYGSPESLEKYHRLLAERAAGTYQPKNSKQPLNNRLLVAEFIERYIQFANGYYGEDSPERYRIRGAVRPLLALYGSTFADDFSPLKLQRVLEKLVADGDTRKPVADRGHRTLSRTQVNDYLASLKRIFKWGVSQELFPGSVYQDLLTVEGLRKGRGLGKKCHEPKKVEPVPPEDIESIMTHLGPEIQAMVRLQLLTGMRPDEVTIIKPCDIDRSASPWVYTLRQHKGEWREGDQTKEVLLGPQAQEVLAPWLEQCEPDQYLFSPKRVAERWNRQHIEATGKKPAFVKLNEIRPPRDHYDDSSYRQAVRRACKRAGVDYWTPGRLRHNAGTLVRAKYGAEAAKLVLGHRHLNTTEIYAEKDREKYAKIMREIG